MTKYFDKYYFVQINNNIYYGKGSTLQKAQFDAVSSFLNIIELNVTLNINFKQLPQSK